MMDFIRIKRSELAGFSKSKTAVVETLIIIRRCRNFIIFYIRLLLLLSGHVELNNPWPTTTTCPTCQQIFYRSWRLDEDHHQRNANVVNCNNNICQRSFCHRYNRLEQHTNSRNIQAVASTLVKHHHHHHHHHHHQ